MADTIKVPVRYIPANLTRTDRKKQSHYLKKSRKQYLSGKYYTRPKVKSFQSKPSGHIRRAEKMYGVERVVPNRALSAATHCSIDALNQIVKKGEGAYYSSGSRPNQSAHSWGYARLASAVTGGKSSAVDFHILEKGCDHKKSKAYKLAKQSLKKYGYGRRHTKRVTMRAN
jgi:hypothetical protein